MQSAGFLTTPEHSISSKELKGHKRSWRLIIKGKAILPFPSISQCLEPLYVAKYKETKSVRKRPGRDRKCKISRTLERKIVRHFSKKSRTSAKMIVADLASSGVGVSRSTVVRALHRGGLQGHRP